MAFRPVPGRSRLAPALALIDLMVGDPAVRPARYRAMRPASPRTSGPIELGTVGAGTGATVGKWRGPDHVSAGGLGGATVRREGLVVSAMIAVNTFGDIDVDGRGLDRAVELPWPVVETPFENTTIGVIVTNARLTKSECLLAAQSGHDGLGRAIVPSHTRFDGDALVVAATGAVDASPELVRVLAAAAVERAVRSLA